MSEWSGYTPLSQSKHQAGMFRSAPFSQHVFKTCKLFLAKLRAVTKLVNTINQRLRPRQMCRWCMQTVASQNLFLCCSLVVQGDVQTPSCCPARTFENPQIKEHNFVRRNGFNLKLPNATVCLQRSTKPRTQERGPSTIAQMSSLNRKYSTTFQEARTGRMVSSTVL